jgi:hypothetical protein
MLTLKQSALYGYKSAHDLPTPPSTSRPSPPLISQDSGHKPLPAIPQSSSQSGQPMSGSSRGLPPPGSWHGQAGPPPQHLQPTLHVPPPPGPHPPHHSQQPGPPYQPPPPPPPPPPQSLPQVPPPPHQEQNFVVLPPFPQRQPGLEDISKEWLLAKAEEDRRRAEEERRRAEEERTRQESLRLDQRRIDYDMLRQSLDGGIPGHMVPIIFAGLGSLVSRQDWSDWARQYASGFGPAHQPQLLASSDQNSPERRRGSQAQIYSQYAAAGPVPQTPVSGQGPPGGGFVQPYTVSSPRSRGYSVPGSGGGRMMGAVQGSLSVNTNVPPGVSGGLPSHHGIASQQQAEPPASSTPITFQYYTGPSSQSSGGNQPATPSGSFTTAKAIA